MAQMVSPFFRTTQVVDERRPISVSDWESGVFGPQAHPESTSGRLAMSSAGSTFEAIRLNNSESSVTPITLQWEGQHFTQSATPWEGRYSPLIRRGSIGEIIPIVDEAHEVVGYFIPKCSTSDLFMGKDGELYFVWKNDLTVLGMGSDAKALRDILSAHPPSVMSGVQSVNGGRDVAYDLVADVNGMISSDVRVKWSDTNGTAVSVDWIFDLATAGPALAKLSLLLGKKLVVGTAKGASKMVMKSLVRIGVKRSVQQSADLLRKELIRKVFIARFGSESMMKAPLVRKNVESLVDYVLAHKATSVTKNEIVESILLNASSGIDLHSPLKVIDLARGTKVASYADLLHPSNLTGSPKSGNWFTLLRGTHGPDQLGIAADGRKRITGMITRDVKVLISKNSAVNDSWTTAVKDGLANGLSKSKGTNVMPTRGGGTQYFHPDARSVIDWGL